MKRHNNVINKAIILIAILVGSISCSNNEDIYDASGTFEATEILISAEVNGKILELDIREGDSVILGQRIGAIDSTQLVLRKKQLLNNIRAVESRRPETHKQIAVLEQQLSTQRKEKERIERLLKENAATGKQLDDITANIFLLEKQLEAQQSTLSIASGSITEDAATLKVQVEQIEDQINKCQIINPLTGTILAKYSEAHELAMPGKALYKIANLTNMTLKAYVTSDQLSQIKLGQPVKVYTDFGEKTREYQGKIIWISSKSEFTPKTIHTKNERANLVYATKIEVINDGFIRIGMYGQVNF